MTTIHCDARFVGKFVPFPLIYSSEVHVDDINVYTMIYYRVAICVYNIMLLYDEDDVRCEKQMFCHVARV